jgi:predicted type IV restriction endonuclease
MVTANKEIWVGIDDNKIKLEGDALEAYLAQLALDQEEIKRLETLIEEAKQKRLIALSKLKAIGLDEDDLKALGL